MNQEQEAAVPVPPSNEDVYDEDTGEYLGTLDCMIHRKDVSFPVRLAVNFHGTWYIYRLEGKYKAEA